MYFKVNKKDFLDSINIVSRAVSSTSPLPILHNIKLAAKENCLQLTASDSDISIQASIVANEDNNLQIINEGSILLDGKYLSDMVRKIDSEVVEVEIVDGTFTNIRGLAVNFELNGIKPESYPLIDFSQPEDSFTLKTNTLKNIIFQTCFAASDKETRPVLTGLNLNCEDKIITDQDKRLQRAQEEIALMNNKSDENDADIQNLNIKLRGLMDDISTTQNGLNKNNLDNHNLDEKLGELNCQCENLKCENANLNDNILREKALRADKERQNQNLNSLIIDHENQINDLNNRYNNLNAQYDIATTDSKNSQIQNDKLKGHIMLLSQQNQKLLDELDNVKCQDLKMQNLLSRKEQSSMILRGVHGCIQQGALCLEKIEGDPIGYARGNLRNNAKEKFRSNSPTYTYVNQNDN